MSVHAINTSEETGASAVWRAKVELAAAHRLAVFHELEEGIDNHFTVTLPGFDDRYLILPFGRHWSEARASEMIVFNEQGKTLEGEGEVELTAQNIHAPIHRITGLRVVMHTHQTWALALNMHANNRIVPASQTAAFFHDQIAYDDDFAGIADTLSEGERLAAVLGDKRTAFMRNHGVMVAGDSIAECYKRLYFIERVCKTQLLAMSTGQPLQLIAESIVAQIQRKGADDRHPAQVRDDLYYAAMMRVLDRELPGYAE